MKKVRLCDQYAVCVTSFQFFGESTDFHEMWLNIMQLEAPPHPRNFLFLTISNNNMADARTCQVEVTEVPLTLEY